MTNDEKELGQPAVFDVQDVESTRAANRRNEDLARGARKCFAREKSRTGGGVFLSHRQRMDEELTDRPLFAAIKQPDTLTMKLEN